MTLSSLVQHLRESTITADLVKRSNREDKLVIQGGSRLSGSLIASSIAQAKEKSLLVIVPTLEDATRWHTLLQLMGWDKTFLYPTSEASPYEPFDPTSEITWGQLQVLSDLINVGTNSKVAIISTERSLQPHLPPPNELKSRSLFIQPGFHIKFDELSLKLTELGYKKVPSVDQEGTWARRGDIIDIYPVSNEYPVRLEFFGEELDKLREFDPLTQKSLEQINRLCVTPTDFNPIILDSLGSRPNNYINELLNENEYQHFMDGRSPEGMRRFIGLAWDKPSSLIDFIPINTFIAIDELSQCIAHGRIWYEHAQEQYNSIIDNKALIQSQIQYNPIHFETNFCIEQLYKLDIAYFNQLSNQNNSDNTFDVSSRPTNIVSNNFGKISQTIKDFIISKQCTWILSAQPSRTVALLEEHECITKFIPNSLDFQSINRLKEGHTPIVLKGNNNIDLEGINLPAWNISFITDKELYGQQSFNSVGYIRRRKQSSSSKVDPQKMTPGDYVVHKNHGIGQFLRIDKICINSDSRDYLVLKYQDGTLSVAADQLGSLGRYRATTGKPPVINKLGGSAWIKAKDRATKVVKKVAIDLVKLYAERSEAKGFAFPNDGPWQDELEDSFPFEPTADQLKAIKEVKVDMQKDIPMDRLVCGDVGFGKTEVAVRAIFKAITAGKQIALLAPTTVLSQQHWRTISDRFAPYPIKISLLNRFKTTSERKEILQGLKDGTIDAVVGTHQLLSTRLKYKNLGLLVIDEEQRFGVTQKEKIKQLKKSVDVLTLTATPIPRTLYMSLSGVREMSLITTPPPLRRPIKTHLCTIDNEIIRSAILQERDRGGQIFYIVPRIDGIEEVEIKLKQMIPDIKILVAHGQMEEGKLENAMVAFNGGEADLLLCTTIVESGLDIPRVNTILIEDAHKFGLSQLYQLRGRVGRSGIQAHAWLFYPDNLKLNSTARQRLRAIQEFTQLGSGYQLAMRDMEIRGIGNLLGVEQSGQLETIGFDLYMEMLQEALAEIKGGEIPQVDDTQIDLSVNAFIPGDWIVDVNEKLSAYRAATECCSLEELMELAMSWNDRYGAIPKPVQSLLEVMKIKLIAKRCGFSRILNKKPNLILETTMEEPAFRILRQGLPAHLHGRVTYMKDSLISKVTFRGLGVLDINSQMTQLLDWLEKMQVQVINEEQKERDNFNSKILDLSK